MALDLHLSRVCRGDAVMGQDSIRQVGSESGQASRVVRQVGSESGQARDKTRRMRKREMGKKTGAEKTLVYFDKQDKLAQRQKTAGINNQGIGGEEQLV
jgi:hypothetical protein